ncbi:MAG: methylenetetrahydrofolate reductase C-terminal domain-containing protein [Candidatus Omnitrophica bacterium]|nr:methylenetetrahydrofolate reductase C-terminal domain-containing protein [Candidatus Omnitrophota bacterium]
MLSGHKNILIAGCDTCVAECATGGEKEVETLAPLLHMALVKDGRSVRILTKTVERQCEWEFVEELGEIVPEVDAILSLACGIGIHALAERFSEIAVYPGVNTTSLAIRDEPGLWTARCTACGDCVLDRTFGLCPIARCAKSLMNGPCGGTRKEGKCEIDENIDCVWSLIVERAEARGELESLRELWGAKDWSNSEHGGPKKVVREDLRQ